jgi:amino acid transporter
MFWIYIPVVLFILPYYAVMSLQDALSVFFGNSVVLPWYVVILIATIFFIYFQYMGIVHKNTSLKQNFILTYMKFIPILFAIFGGIFYFALAGSQNTILAGDDTGPMRLSQLSPVFGVISAIPAIFFAFDGFYTATSAYENMKEPKKFSSALSIGIALTGALYMLISIGMLLGAKGGAITG